MTSIERFMLGDAKTTSAIRQEFLLALNRAQGTAKDVKFLDADTALDAISRTGFHLLDVDFSGAPVAQNSIWESIKTTHEQFKQYLQLAEESEMAAVHDETARLRAIVGSDEPAGIFNAIAATVTAIQKSNRTMRFTLNPTLTAKELQRVLAQLDESERYEGHKQRLWLSGAGDIVAKARNYATYLENFMSAASTMDASLGGESETNTELDAELSRLESTYDETLQRLRGIEMGTA